MVYIADTATVSELHNVIDNSRIEGTAHVGRNVLTCGDAEVYGNAIIKSRNVFKIAIFTNNCHVFGNAIIDVSHFKEGIKFIFGRGCKIGGWFDLREYPTIDDFVEKYSENCELSWLSEDEYSSKMRCVKVTDVWLM